MTTAQQDWAEYMERLGGAIREARARTGVSQEDIAAAIGISRASLQRLERGATSPGVPANPSLNHVMAIAQALEVSMDELLPQPWPDFQLNTPAPRRIRS